MWVLIILVLNAGGLGGVAVTPIYFVTEEACQDAQIKLGNAYLQLRPQPQYAITCLDTHGPTPPASPKP